MALLITINTPQLFRIPAALFLASIALIAGLGYIGPTVVGIVLSLVLHNLYVAPPFGHWSFSAGELVKEAVLLLVAAGVGYLNVRNRRAQKEQAILIERIKTAEEEERKALASYEEQAKALALAQQAGKSAAWIMDVDQEEVKWLPGGFEIFGRPFSEFVGRVRPVSLVEPQDQPRIMAALKKTLETGVPFQPEFRIRWPDGEMHWQEARGVRDAENPRVIRGTTFDITERKNAELSLLRVEKLAAVGRIASTIAHEINNPLASITNLLYLALLDPSLPEPVREYLQLAQQELSRLTNVTRLTLSYARPQTQPRRVDPAEVMESVLFLFRSRLEAKSIQVIRNVTEPVSITIFVDELQRIFTNLIANAIDAVDSRGGVMRIVLERQGSQVLLAIEDNGMGIPGERIDRIFDPFFTTKEEVGTGIGLWVTKELVEKNHGAISLRSGSFDDGMRTRFEVCFPLA